jgi:F-type H+-transporting ATPase subunit a
MIGSLLGQLLPLARVPMISNFSWFELLPGFGEEDHLAHTLGMHEQEGLTVIATSWLVVAVVLLFAFVARGQLRTALARAGTDKYVADERLTARNAAEVLVEGLRTLFSGTLQHNDVDRFFPFLAGIFTYIFCNNLAGFIPGLPPATESVSNNLAMAIVVFLVFNIAGLARNGFGYVAHLAGPRLPILLIPVTILVFAIELFGLFLRPATLTIRLSANIFADHLVGAIMRDLGAGLGVFGPIMAVILPLPFYALGLLVCFIQAFVFTLLTTIYIGLAVAHDEGHH